MDPIFERLSQVVCDVFTLYQDEPLELTEETTAADVPGWDSLMHVTVVVHVERAFHVRFSSAEVGSLKKLGDLAQLVRRHLAASGQAIPA